MNVPVYIINVTECFHVFVNGFIMNVYGNVPKLLTDHFASVRVPDSAYSG